MISLPWSSVMVPIHVLPLNVPSGISQSASQTSRWSSIHSADNRTCHVLVAVDVPIVVSCVAIRCHTDIIRTQSTERYKNFEKMQNIFLSGSNESAKKNFQRIFTKL
jgi:hypothetical protein